MANYTCRICLNVFTGKGRRTTCDDERCRIKMVSDGAQERKKRKKLLGYNNRTLSMNNEEWALAKKIGKGSGVAGIRYALSFVDHTI